MDISFVRSKFPALKKDFVFMDNAGGSQILGSVINRMNDHLIHRNVQLGASYEISKNAGERLSNSQDKIAQFINARSKNEIVIGPSTTMLLRILSLCISRAWIAGDEIIVTNSDHEANVSCWTDLQRLGIKIKIWKINPDSLKFEIDDLKQLLSKRTKLVAMVHVSNVLGTINPIYDISKVVHEAGAFFCIDGVAYAPHRKVNVMNLGADFYVFSWYKVYGPHLAVLWGKQNILNELESINHYFIGKDQVPYKLQPGNFNFELTAGLEGIVDYFREFSKNHNLNGPLESEDVYTQCYAMISEYEENLITPLIEFLNINPKVKIIGSEVADRNIRVPTVSFIHEDLRSSMIVEKVDNHNMGIRFGDFYAKKLINDLKLELKEGVVRISPVHYNSAEEVQKLIEVLDNII